MKTFDIKIGKGKSVLTIDAARLVEGRCLIQGASGSGKSYLVRVIAEQAIPGGLQTILLDPEGEFITLREQCDVVNMSAKSGTFSNYLSKLRSLQLISRSQPFVAVEELRS